jgi:hypothetical protein
MVLLPLGRWDTCELKITSTLPSLSPALHGESCKSTSIPSFLVGVLGDLQTIGVEVSSSKSAVPNIGTRMCANIESSEKCQ